MERVVAVDDHALRQVEVTSHVLRVGYPAECAVTLAVLMPSENAGESVEHVSRCLNVPSDHERVFPVSGEYGCSEGVVDEIESQLCDEQVLVVITQDGILFADGVEILLAERGRYPRHVDVVDLKQVESVLEFLVDALPTVSPCGGEHAPVELRTVLVVELHGYL